MNCKQGDLARVVPKVAAQQWARGCIVRCEKFAVGPDGSPGWVISPELRHPNGLELIWGIADEILRPINNPPDDAVDEMVKIVGPAPALPVTEDA